MDIPNEGGVCPNNTFSCDSGEYILNFHVCDGVNHCSDSSDESDQCLTENNNPHKVPCHDDAFHCGEGVCISISFVCDYIQHCQDGADENFCCKFIQV